MWKKRFEKSARFLNAGKLSGKNYYPSRRGGENVNRSHTKGMVEGRLGVAFESALSGSKPEVVSS